MTLSNLPDFIDNEFLKLSEALNQLLRSQTRADIASGFFNLAGYALVKDALQGLPKLRLLLSRGGASGGELYPAGFRNDLSSTPLAAHNRVLAKELVGLLIRPEVEVRLYTSGFFHGKAYIFDDIAIIGSSNFTGAGLTSNTELNSVHKQGYAAQAAREWFERFWEQSEDYKPQLIQLLQQSKHISTGYSPYMVFLKSLYEYFKDELTVDLTQGRDIGKSLVDLADFQQKAFERSLRILEKYDGVFIADSVGLGKTWIGKKLLEHYGYFQRSSCLVIAPAQLKEMWEDELRSIHVAAQVVSMESMGRQDFEPRQHYDVEFVLLDESHNFRNSNKRYTALSRIMSAGRRKKAILLTATPINNSVFDLYNQIMLFARGDQYFARAGIPRLRSYFIQAIRDGDLLNLLEEVMIRRTRQFVKQEFPNAVINGDSVRFPERKLHTERYDLEALSPGIYEQIGEFFGNVAFAVYNTESYLSKPSPVQDLERQRNEALIALIKSLLLKRFESSVEAFRISLQRQIAFHERFIEVLMQGRLLSSKECRQLLVMGDEDEIGALLQTLPTVEASAFKRIELAQAAAEDLERLRAMYRLVQGLTIHRDPKIAKLLDLIRAKPGKKLVVFSYFQDTVGYLQRAFREVYPDQLRAVRWEVVDGAVSPKSRTALLKRFAPRSQKAEIAPSDELDLLLATDVLSEGQNLQDADTLVNFDLHWNPTRMVQRAGRIDRLGSPFEVIHIHNFFPEEGLEGLLGLVKKLMDKIEQIDKNVGLDASILGEIINPRTFNALRRIEQEDSTIAEELEAEAELSSEFMRSVLSAFLQTAGVEQLEAIPYGVHSGMAKRDTRGVFLHFKVRGEHLWRFYDVDKGKVIDSKQRIFSIIQCVENTPRVEGAFDIDAIIREVSRQLLDDLNVQHAKTVEEFPKAQRQVIATLRGLARHTQVDRMAVLVVLKALNQQLSPVLVRELDRIFKSFEHDSIELMQALSEFVERYHLTPSETTNQGGQQFGNEDLELVVYMTHT